MFFAQTSAPNPTTWAEYWHTGWIIWLSAFCILAIYSYLFKDNPVYRAVVQIFIGLNIGYGVIVNWRDILYPQWWLPMTDGFKALLFNAPGSKWSALWALVGVLGLFWYFQLSRKYIWLSRIVIGLTVGIGAGLTFKSQFGQNLPQVVDSFRPLGPSVIAQTPRKRFDLPPTTVTPVLADPVLYVADDKQAQCVEILGGRQVWSTPLPSKPIGALRLEGDSLIVPVADGELPINKDTGIVAAVRPASIDNDFQPNTCSISGVIDENGKEYTAKIVIEDGIPVAYKEGKVVWKAKPDAAADRVYDGGRYLFAVKGNRFRVIDPSTGEVLHVLTVPEKNSFASIGRMPEPIQDYLIGLVPTDDTVLNGYFVKDDLTTGYKAGERYWSIDTNKPIIWTSSLDGVVFATGPEGGECYELPPPAKRNGPVDFFNNWVFVVALLSVMTYFFFSFRQRTAKGVAQFSLIGRWVLMIGFGAIFGNTIMTRMSFLLDRLQFLVDEWLKPFWHFLLG